MKMKKERGNRKKQALSLFPEYAESYYVDAENYYNKVVHRFEDGHILPFKPGSYRCLHGEVQLECCCNEQ
jgi:hypothetical protein